MLKVRQQAIRRGYRSGLELDIQEQMKKLGVKAEYECFKIPYLVPAKSHKYTPDFLLPNGIVIETKGRFTVEDRNKHLLIQQQHPDLELRFVFSNANGKIRKGSKTTYAMWCEKHHFQYANKTIPQEWSDEPVHKKSIVLIKALRTSK